MSLGIPERSTRVGKRWPQRFLNFLPPRQLWRYLTWKSGGIRQEEPFDLGRSLIGAHRILMVLPESVPEFLLSIPVVQAYFQTRPEAAIWILAGPRETPFLTSIFGRERILTLDPDQFFLGEEHFHDLLGRTQGMRPDLVVNFRVPSPPLLQYLLRVTLAPLRVYLDPGAVRPFSNISLPPSEPLNHYRQFQMAARLWDAANIPMAGKWTRLVPPNDAMSRAELLLKPAGIQPKSTVLFPWQAKPIAAQAALLKEVIKENRAQGRSVAVLQAEGGLFESPAVPAEICGACPCLRTDTVGTLLALFASTAGTAGMLGPLLLLAGLSDTDVTGYFGPEDMAFDTSGWNARMKVVPLPTPTGISPASSPAGRASPAP